MDYWVWGKCRHKILYDLHSPYENSKKLWYLGSKKLLTFTFTIPPSFVPEEKLISWIPNPYFLNTQETLPHGLPSFQDAPGSKSLNGTTFRAQRFPIPGGNLSCLFSQFCGVWFWKGQQQKPQKKIESCHKTCITVSWIFCPNTSSKWHHLHTKPAFQTKVVCFLSMFLPVSQSSRLIPSKLSNCPSHGCPLSSCSAPEVTKWCFFRELTWGPHGTTIVDLEKEKNFMNLTHSSKTPIKGQSQPFLNYAL